MPLNPNRTPEWVGASDPYDVHEPTGELLAEIPRTLEVLWGLRGLALTATEQAVLIALICRSSPQAAWRCWPSVARLALDARLSAATVHRALSKLRAKGLVSWISRHREQRPNLYQVCVWRWT